MAQTIKLPPRTDGAEPIVLANAARITVIGANGAGKTRFCKRMQHDAEAPVFTMSALHALYVRDPLPQSPQPGSIDARFLEADRQNQYIKVDATTEFER